MWLEQDFSKEVDIDQIVSNFTKDDQMLSKTIKKIVANDFKNGFKKAPPLKAISIKFPFSNKLKVSLIIDKQVEVTDYNTMNVPKHYLYQDAFLSGFLSDRKKLANHLFGGIGRTLMISDKNDLEIKEIEEENLNSIQFLNIKTDAIFQDLIKLDKTKTLSLHENMEQFVLLVNLKKALLSLKLIGSIFETEKTTKVINFSLTNGKIRVFTNNRKYSEKTKQKIALLKLIVESKYNGSLKMNKISLEKGSSPSYIAMLFLTEVYTITHDSSLQDDIKKVFNLYCISEENRILSDIVKKENIKLSNTLTYKKRI